MTPPHEKPPSPCCPPRPPAPPCSPAPPPSRTLPYLRGALETAAGPVPRVKTSLTPADHLGRWQMRWGLGRGRYRVPPGLYAAGSPGPEAPVLVTANYKMTFDLLRRELEGLDLWILVLDTRGINVWCAAGKGTFGTGEVVRRVRAAGLDRVVTHRTLVLPQLGAPGVSAREVREKSGFGVAYGPVRARDIRAFLAAGMQATPEMRRVTFSALERFVLTPVELVNTWKTTLGAVPLLLVLGGLGKDFFSTAAALQRGGGALATYLAGVAAGAVLTPLLLPWLPGRAFATKGATLGGTVALAATAVLWKRLGGLNAAALLLCLPAVSSWFGMHFTGSSTFTSPTGVEKEMRRAIPLQGGALLLAAILWIGAAF